MKKGTMAMMAFLSTPTPKKTIAKLDPNKIPHNLTQKPVLCFKMATIKTEANRIVRDKNV